VIYDDASSGSVVEQPLFDAQLRLTGKPDYVVHDDDAIVPVEVKSGRTPKAPYEAHIFQLAAYCLLVECSYGARPAYGIIRYPQRTFAIDYTPALEADLYALLDEMRRAERASDGSRSHDQAARCASCGYRESCDQRLYR
jgi:CRISPR-associated exonuclease Cas4